MSSSSSQESSTGEKKSEAHAQEQTAPPQSKALVKIASFKRSSTMNVSKKVVMTNARLESPTPDSATFLNELKQAEKPS